MSAARGMESIIDTRIVELKEKLTKLFVETGDKMDFAQWSQYDSSYSVVGAYVLISLAIFRFFAYDGKISNLFIISGMRNWPRLGTSKPALQKARGSTKSGL